MGKSGKNKKNFQPSNTNKQQPTVPQQSQMGSAAENGKSETLKKASGKEVYIVWTLLAAIITWLLGCFLYDYLGTLISLILIATGAIGLISALFTIFGAKIDIADESKKSFILAISTGVIIGGALSFFVCTSLGFRLKFIPDNSSSNDPETVTTLDSGAVDTEAPEIFTEDPIDDLPEEESLPTQEPVAPEAPPQGGLRPDFVGSEVDPDPNTPITVTVSPEGESLISFNVLKDFYKMIGIPDENGLSSVTAESKDFLESVLTDKIKSFCNLLITAVNLSITSQSAQVFAGKIVEIAT